MTLVYQSSTTINGSPTIRGGCTWEAGNEALLVDSGVPCLRRYNLSTFAQTASTTVLNFPATVAMINSASCVVIPYSGSTVEFYDLASNTRGAVSSGFNSTNNGVNQLSASDLTNNIIMYVGATTNIGVVRASNYSVSVVTPRTSSSNRVFNCVTFKEAGRWLVGTTGGGLYELDAFGNIYGQMDIQLTPKVSGLTQVDGGSDLSSLDISGLFWDSGILGVSTTTGNFFLVDWGSKTIIASRQFAFTDSSFRPCLVNAGSGIMVASLSNNTSNPGTCIEEVDMVNKAPRVRDNLYTASTSTIAAIGANSTNGRGWAVQSSSGPIRFFDVQADRAITTRAFSVTIGGVHQQARLILLDETSGTATGRPILDTIMQSPTTYSVPSGKNVIEIVKVGEGYTSLWQVNRYTT